MADLVLGPFVQFLDELQGDPSLQKAFKADPHGVGGQHGITDLQADTIASRDTTTIDAATEAELKAKNPGRDFGPRRPHNIRFAQLSELITALQNA